MFIFQGSIYFPTRRQLIRDLRSVAPPSDVRVYDQNRNLLRIEPPTFWEQEEIIKKKRAK